MSTEIKRPIAVLGLGETPSAVATTSEAIIRAMTGNPSFPSPTPSLPTFAAQVTALVAAIVALKTRAPGTLQAKNQALRVVLASAEQLRNYVQQIADTNLDTSATVIHSAGMRTRRNGINNKPAFAVKPGPVSGSVHAVARAQKRATFEWQLSTDQKSWTTFAGGTKASASVSGLTVATVYYFRFRTTSKSGFGDWCAPVSIIVT